MKWLEGGEFSMGSADFYPEERPVRRVVVDGFWIDTDLITNAEFARFVDETGYRTVAERPLDPGDFPGVPEDKLFPGGLVFHKTDGPVDLGDYFNWWDYVVGASWMHPQGPESDLVGLDEHPVVQVCAEDVEAYAMWAGKELPSEAEWEFAARGGLEGAVYVWGDEFAPNGRMMANTWQGEFPWQNLESDGYLLTSPVGSFAPNGYGLHDMAGNVWEWTSDYFVTQRGEPEHACCAPRNPRSLDPAASLIADEPGATTPRRVLKGGSHLCAPSYCLRYRPAARSSETIDTSTSHIGFRCIKRPKA